MATRSGAMSVEEPAGGATRVEQPAAAEGRTGLRLAIDRIQKIDLRATWQIAAGAVFVPLGILIIMIAWYGAAHTAYVQQQIPYLVSGSFVGLGFMILGGLLYWAHWLYRVYDQADLQHAAQMARQEELFERLINAVTVMGATTAAPSVPDIVAVNGTETYLATASGSNVHRQDCPVVTRHPAGLRRVSAREAQDLKPCRICQPQVGAAR